MTQKEYREIRSAERKAREQLIAEAGITAEMLHPNLARIAVMYDRIQADFAAGKIEPSEARHRIRRLAARDDQGVSWVISPNDGGWYRETIEGRLVADIPPKVGKATASPFDVSGNGTHPDQQIEKYEAAERLATERIVPSGKSAGRGRYTGLAWAGGVLLLVAKLAEVIF